MVTAQNKKVIVHTHAPKTGGGSIRAMLELALPMGSVYTIWTRPSCEPDVGNAHATIIKNSQFRDTIKAVHGHIEFGWHEKAGYKLEEVQYMTVLRDPVERVWSAYQNALRVPEGWDFAGEKSLENFIAQVPEARDGLTKRFSGDGTVHLSSAIANLSSSWYFIVWFPHLVYGLSSLLGKKARYCHRHSGGKYQTPNPDEMRLIEKENSNDIFLYRSLIPCTVVNAPARKPAPLIQRYNNIIHFWRRFWSKHLIKVR